MRLIGVLLVLVGAIGLGVQGFGCGCGGGGSRPAGGGVAMPTLAAGVAVTVGLILVTVGGRRTESA